MPPNAETGVRALEAEKELQGGNDSDDGIPTLHEGTCGVPLLPSTIIALLLSSLFLKSLFSSVVLSSF